MWSPYATRSYVLCQRLRRMNPLPPCDLKTWVSDEYGSEHNWYRDVYEAVGHLAEAMQLLCKPRVWADVEFARFEVLCE